MSFRFKALFVAAVLGALAALATSGAHAEEQATYRFDLPAQPLADALRAIARQTGANVLFASKDLQGVTAPALRAQLTASEAIERVLAGTKLQAERTTPTTVIVQPVSSLGRPSSPTDEMIRRERLAQAGGFALSPAAAGGQAADETPKPSSAQAQEDSARTVSEIVVTAQKRTERLQDVPVPVTAIVAESLAANNMPQLRDYFSRIPGLNLTEAGIYGGSVISIRGITSGIFNDGTATVVIDDVPYGISSASGPGEVVPEIDPGDLARLEVLRGPQGTLYGASSMGGLLKYVTIDPSTEKLSGYVRGGVSSVRNGDGGGYNVSAGINVPLSETWALRASGFTRVDPGYIDDPVHGLEGVNRGEVSGGRLSALWRPSENFSLKLAALYQDAQLDGNPYAGPTVGFGALTDLQQVAPPGSGGYSKKLQVYTANISARLGSVDLTTISAYSRNDATYVFDVSPLFGGVARTNFGVTGGKSVSVGTTDRFTQEVRFTVPLGQKVEWLFGGFYVDEDNPRIGQYLALDFATGQPVGSLGYLDFPSTFKEYAAFTDVTYHFTDRFDVQIGGRYAANRQTLPHYDNDGPLFGGPHSQAEVESKDHSFTYLLTPRLKVSEDLMVYARLASGYRPGGPNLSTSSDPAIPLSYLPDETRNYEIGVKGSAFDRLLTFDASVYHIDWKDILLGSLVSPRSLNYKDNGKDAKSEGVDLSFEVRPAAGLTISAWGAWNRAELTQNFPTNSTVRGVTGDRLPFSSRFSGSLSIDQQFPLGANLEGFVGATHSYIGDRKGPFTATAQQTLPAYTNTDFHVGARWQSWEANLYLNNAFDKRGLLNGGLGGFLPSIYTYTRPRTLGMTVSRKF